DAGGSDGSSSEDAANGGVSTAGGIGCFGSGQSSGREMGGKSGPLDNFCEASFRYSLSQDEPRFSGSPVAGVILPPLVLTGPGCANVSYARALAAGFANTLPQPCLVADLAHLPPLVLTGPGFADVSYARALAAGFADTLPQPCLVGDHAQCLHALFAPINQSDDLSDTSTNHVAPVDPSSVSSLAPSTPPRPKSPQFHPKSPQFRSKAALALAKPEDAAALLKEMLSGREVMVVDDNAVNRMVARKTLQGLGAKVELVESGEKALERLSSSNAFAVLLIDLHMPPGIDGYETARRIRAQQLIFALTADVDTRVRQACKEAGMDGTLSKPIAHQELLSAIKAAGVTLL
ncbi:unnamed protein product, partial [Closterium sp. Yama58-4]